MDCKKMSSGARRRTDILLSPRSFRDSNELMKVAPCSCGRAGRFGCGSKYDCPRTKRMKTIVPAESSGLSSTATLVPTLSSGKNSKSRIPIRRHRSESKSTGTMKAHRSPGSDSSAKMTNRGSPSPPTRRFDIALSKSITARERFLSRPLSQAEFTQLCNAVRKQISRVNNSRIEATLGSISQRVDMLEKACPAGAFELKDSIALFSSQISILRKQYLETISEDNALSEVCSHFREKKSVHFPKDFVISQEFNGLGWVSCRNTRGTVHLCCLSCEKLRDDAIFNWSGCEAKSFEAACYDAENIKLPSSFRTRSILASQTVWSHILDHRFNRT